MRSALALFPALSLAILLSSGCSMFKGAEKKEDADAAKKAAPAADKTADNQGRQLAEQYLDGILAGLKDRNYNMFVQNLVAERREVITKDKFREMADSIQKEKGAYKSRVFLDSISKGPLRTFFWKAQYRKVDSASKKETSVDVFVTLTIGHVDNKEQVFGMSFQ